MAYLILKNSILWDEAQALAQRYQNCIVGVQMLKNYERVIQPIVQRVAIKKYYYNYYADNTYHKTQIEKDGKEVAGYGLYLPVPDEIRYHDLLMFCRQQLLPLKGVFRTYALFKTEDELQFVYAVAESKVMMDVNVPFDGNPVFYFVYGGDRENTYDPDKYRRMRARQRAGIIGQPGRPCNGSTHIAEETMAARNIKTKMGRPKKDPNAPKVSAVPYIPPIHIIDDDCD